MKMNQDFKSSNKNTIFKCAKELKYDDDDEDELDEKGFQEVHEMINLRMKMNFQGF